MELPGRVQLGCVVDMWALIGCLSKVIIRVEDLFGGVRREMARVQGLERCGGEFRPIILISDILYHYYRAL